MLFPPGTRKAIETCSKMLGWSLVIFPVGPKKTDQMSTHGMIAATSADPGDVLEVREEPEAEQNEREQLRQVEEHVEVGDSRPDRDRAQSDCERPQPRPECHRQQQQHEDERRRDQKTSAMKRMSGQRPALQR